MPLKKLCCASRLRLLTQINDGWSVTWHDFYMPYNLRWNNPRYWHRRAEEARTIAETMNNIDARAGMLRLAADYEAMAQRAEEWAAETERQSVALTENRSHFIKDATTPSAP